MQQQQQNNQLSDFLNKIASTSDPRSLEELRIDIFGRKGWISSLYGSLKSLGASDKAARGAEINDFRKQLETSLKKQNLIAQEKDLSTKLKHDAIDASLPLANLKSGSLHVVQQTIDEVVAIFGSMGFKVAEGPEIEDDFHNFTALNFPPGHPARDMHDTFFLPPKPNQAVDIPPSGAGGKSAADSSSQKNSKQKEINLDRVLRTHTSTVQVRTMMGGKPPFRVISPGRCYRCDSDMTHTPMFHQVEGLLIDTKPSMAELKGCLTKFINDYFENPNIGTRFRPSFFPFTEPSAELDINYRREKNRIVVGEGEDWLEILGCGMVHSNVIKNCGLDPEKWSGFAFGMGLERIAMLKYGIHDLRLFFESGGEWLKHYGFSPLFSSSTVRGLRGL